jgi:hypothetical protein
VVRERRSSGAGVHSEGKGIRAEVVVGKRDMAVETDRVPLLVRIKVNILTINNIIF